MSQEAGESLDVIGELIAKRNLSGSEVNSLYMFFCSCIYSAIQAGEVESVTKSLERLLGKGPDAEDAEMGKWGPN